MELKYHIKSEIHININDLVYYFEETYPAVFEGDKYAYSKWFDAILDYLDIFSITSGCSYMLYRPNRFMSDHWINEYIGRLFYDCFPDYDMVYLDD